MTFAIQEAFGEPIRSIGIKSAKDYGPFLLSHGYIKVNKDIGECVSGNVVIFEAVRTHRHGHIQIKCSDGLWRSDFIQTSNNPWRDREAGDLYHVYTRP